MLSATPAVSQSTGPAVSQSTRPAVSRSTTPAAGQTPEREAPAETTLGTTAGLAEFVAYAVARNPLLQSWADRHTASTEVAAQVSALPDPMLSYGIFARTPETRVGPQQNVVGLSQKLPFPGKLSLRGQIARKDAEVWERTYEERLLDLVRDVSRAYYDYYRIYHVIRVTEEEKDVIRRMQDVAQVRYASGIVTQQDVLKAQLSLSALEDKLTTLRRDLQTVSARLNHYLDRTPDAPLAEPRLEPRILDGEDVDALYARARDDRPELAAAGVNIEKAEAARALARREYYPDFTFSVNYTFVDERPVPLLDDNGKDVLQLKAAINLPIWLGKRRARVREAEANIAMARNRQAGLRTKIDSEVQDAYSRVRAAHDLVRLYDNVIIPQAQHTFFASEAGYQTGKVDFLNYLDSQRMMLSLRQTQISLVADLGRQHVDLERALGASLDRYGKQ
jgi:outer membrane protein TolC